MATASKVKLKLLVAKKANKVLFAEAGKDFVDFLFYLLTLPVGTVIRLLNERGEVGSLSHLHKSIQNLCGTYMQPGQNKNSVLNPRSSICAVTEKIPLLQSDHESYTPKIYMCRQCYRHRHWADVPGSVCPQCRNVLNYEVTTYVAPATSSSGSEVEGGFVKRMVTYMVTDDLELKPMSTISAITLLNEFNVQNVSTLKEVTVVLDEEEGLKLLKASLESKNVLTSVFLGNFGCEKSSST